MICMGRSACRLHVEHPPTMNELGQLLREARESQGISLAVAETQTRIRQKFIAAMEAEDWTLLPNEVTTRGFLRKYAGYLGLDEEIVLQRFQSRGNPGTALPATAPALDREVDYRPIEMDLSSPPRRSIPWGWVGAAIVLAALFGAALAIYFFQPGWITAALALPRSLTNPAAVIATLPATAQEPTATVEINRITATPTATEVAAPTATVAATPTAAAAATTIAATEVATPTLAALAEQPVERVVLDLALLARSWVRVVADNRVALEAVLEPGELRSFEAVESIVLRTGNGEGVQVTLNGQTLPPLGGAGEVVEIQWRIVDGVLVQSTPTPLPPAAPAAAPDLDVEPTPEDTPTP